MERIERSNRRRSRKEPCPARRDTATSGQVAVLFRKNRCIHDAEIAFLAPPPRYLFAIITSGIRRTRREVPPGDHAN